MNRKVSVWQLVAAVGGVLVIAAVAITLVVRSTNKTLDAGYDTASTNQNSKRSDPSSANTNPLSNAVLFDMSQTATYRTQTLHINSATASSVVSNPEVSQSRVADPNTQWLIVNATVTNTTSAPISFTSFGFIDNNGNIYADAISDDLTLLEDLPNPFSDRTLNPNVPETGNMLFKIPLTTRSGVIGGVNNSNGKVTGIRIDF